MRNETVLVGFTAVTNLADGIGRIALPVLAVGLTDSPALVAGVGMTLTLPWLLASLHVGVLVDRADRRRLAVLANLVRLAAAAVLLVALTTGLLSLPLLYAAGFAMGLAEVVVSSAIVALVPAAVPGRRLTRANAWIAGAETVANEFAGPAVGGLLAGIGVSLALGSAAAGFALGALLLALLVGRFRAERAAPPEPRAGAVAGAPTASLAGAAGAVEAGRSTAGVRGDERVASVWAEIKEGLAFLWRDRLLRTLSLTITVLGGSWGAWLALMPLYATDVLRLGASGYGMLISAIGVGGLVGAATVTLVNRALGVRWALFADLVGTFLMVFVPVVAPRAWAVGVAAFLGGMGGTLWNVNARTIAQRLVPGRLRGRYAAAARLLGLGAMPLAALIAGVIAQVGGVRVAFAPFAAAAAVLVWPFLRTVTDRELARSDPDHEKIAESGNIRGRAAVS
ncbi:MFS transporter [Thermoactinospora rubra]|uniref:MFS transporter n=1 Tax=Thermoactinospora rubra TaxID=1088767 RepID=UPI000A0FB217|nr:MFS transporter [Thermoactinospora rubra]